MMMVQFKGEWRLAVIAYATPDQRALSYLLASSEPTLWT
jgi:hypothetical protein